MGSPKNPVTLTAEQIDELNRKLATLRHDINNHLSLVIAAMEMVRFKPEMAERMTATMGEQPAKISQALLRFSGEFERALGINRDGGRPGSPG